MGAQWVRNGESNKKLMDKLVHKVRAGERGQAVKRDAARGKEAAGMRFSAKGSSQPNDSDDTVGDLFKLCSYLQDRALQRTLSLQMGMGHGNGDFLLL
jgi:hypothetical protein